MNEVIELEKDNIESYMSHKHLVVVYSMKGCKACVKIKPDKKKKKLGKLLYEIIVEYQLYKGIMYPNYISFNNSFELYIGPYRSLNQFREFFVQELDMDTKKPKDNFYMIKDQPIFKNQPIAPKKKQQEYWMNTPLKN